MNLLDADPSKQHISHLRTNVHQQLSCSVLFLHTLVWLRNKCKPDAGSHGTFSKVLQPVNSWHHLCTLSPASSTYTRAAQALEMELSATENFPEKELYTAMCLTKPSSLQNALLSLSMQEKVQHQNEPREAVASPALQISTAWLHENYLVWEGALLWTGKLAQRLQKSLASYIMLQQYHIPTEDLEGGAILDCRLLNLSAAGCSIMSTPVQVLKPANKALSINVMAAEINQIWAV